MMRTMLGGAMVWSLALAGTALGQTPAAVSEAIAADGVDPVARNVWGSAEGFRASGTGRAGRRPTAAD